MFTSVERTGNVCKLDCTFFRVKDFLESLLFFKQHYVEVSTDVMIINYYFC